MGSGKPPCDAPHAAVWDVFVHVAPPGFHEGRGGADTVFPCAAQEGRRVARAGGSQGGGRVAHAGGSQGRGGFGFGSDARGGNRAGFERIMRKRGGVVRAAGVLAGGTGFAGHGYPVFFGRRGFGIFACVGRHGDSRIFRGVRIGSGEAEAGEAGRGGFAKASDVDFLFLADAGGNEGKSAGGCGRENGRENCSCGDGGRWRGQDGRAWPRGECAADDGEDAAGDGRTETGGGGKYRADDLEDAVVWDAI